MAFSVGTALRYNINSGSLTYSTGADLDINPNSLIMGMFFHQRARLAAVPNVVSAVLSNGQAMTKRGSVSYVGTGSAGASSVGAELWWCRARGLTESGLSIDIEYDQLTVQVFAASVVAIDGVSDFDTPFDNGVGDANPVKTGNASFTNATLTPVTLTHVKKKVLNIAFFMSSVQGFRGPFSFGTSMYNENGVSGSCSLAATYEEVDGGGSPAPDRSVNFAGSLRYAVVMADALNGENAPDAPQVRPVIFLTG